MKKIIVAAVVLIASALTVSAQTQSREDILQAIKVKRAELAKLEKAFLSPAAEDEAAYADFLAQPETGLLRLLPREIYDAEVYKNRSKLLTLRGGGSYYSFTERSHDYSQFTDIGLEQGQLKAGFAGANYGMLTNLGDVPLENVSLEMPAVHVLAMHTPAADEPHARIEQSRTSKGVTVGDTSYTNRMPLVANTTYLVRSINYAGSDALVAFRVVRIDTDGSAIILWKLLKKYPVPQLARN